MNRANRDRQEAKDIENKHAQARENYEKNKQLIAETQLREKVENINNHRNQKNEKNL